LLSLVFNALESQGERAGRVRVGATADESTARLWVEDDAPRLSPSVLDQLSANPATLRPDRSGPGLRLLAARSLVRPWGGDLLVTDVARGNRFDLILQLWPGAAAT
jgi:signal transduction histidine kinase